MNLNFYFEALNKNSNCVWSFKGDAGWCADAVITQIRPAWKAFYELLRIFTNRGVTLSNRVNIFAICVESVLFVWKWSLAHVNRRITCLKRSNNDVIIRWALCVKIDQPYCFRKCGWRENCFFESIFRRYALFFISFFFLFLCSCFFFFLGCFFKLKTYILIHTWLCGRMNDKKKIHPGDFWKEDYFFGMRKYCISNI